MIKKTTLITLIIILIITIISILIWIYYYTSKYKTSVIQVSPDIALLKIKNNQYDFIIDVRTEDEWNVAHLPFENVINIPIGNLVSELPKKIINKEANILFVCKRGIRAEAANVIANKLGYKNIEFLDREYSSLLE